MKIYRMTLKQHMVLKEVQRYKRTGLASQVLNEEIETELADHIKTLAAMFHSLTDMK